MKYDLDLIGLLMLVPPEKRLSILPEIIAGFMGCSRCCIMLTESWIHPKKTHGKKDHGEEIIIVAGYPENEHPLGNKIESGLGKEKLQSVLEKGNIKFSSDPGNSTFFSYMRDLIADKKITAIQIVPLYSKKIECGKKVCDYRIPPFGLLVFDWTMKDLEKVEKASSKANILAKLIVDVILNEKKRQDEEEMRIRMACNNVLNSGHSLGLQDGLRNLLAHAPTWLNKLVKQFDLLSKEIPDNERMEKAKSYVERLQEDFQKFEPKAQDAIEAVSFCPSKLALAEHNVQETLEEARQAFLQKNPDLAIRIGTKKLKKGFTSKFDRERIKKCLLIIMENALVAGAKKIHIEIIYRDNGSGRTSITVANDGTRMSEMMARQIFNLMGGRLALVKAIIDAHGGEIQVIIQPETKFVIYLP